ncbi:response regulator [Marinobacter sp. CHS3-4]|uniref:response regulator n=1 Tax=Marinobacter sp. CHS3-4 TaxID=3045174 RepID=UPI0024B5565E|nr:response regulator [Marinobacter sp. CHS3-4]MDI9244023.1 response regulator [Marinobacter sp. CHS3-4]
MAQPDTLQRILLVEDEEDIRAVAEVALETVGGFTLKTCASGRDAIDAIDEFAPQLVILDVMMPGMDGPETLQAIRQLPNHEQTPAVFMTAKVQSDEVASYLAEGAVAVIPKPFDPMTLSDRVREIWQSC